MRNVLITGGTSGLGYELVKCFLRQGCNVYSIGRNSTIINEPGERFHFIKMDLADFADVAKGTKELLADVNRFDIVINNAGVLSPPVYSTTINGNEYSFQVNFLSHLLLNGLIIKAKSDTDHLMIASVTSPVYKYFRPDFVMPERLNYHPLRSYAESKTYILLIGRYLERLYNDKNIRHIGLDPGTFSSGISRMQKKWFQKMYNVAAPFMRKPDKIASAFTGILMENRSQDDVILNSKRKHRTLNYIDNQAAEDFMDKCYSIIEPFF